MTASSHDGVPRDRKGRWVKGIQSVARDAEAFRLKSNGWTLEEIASHLGYYNGANVHRAIKKAMEKYERPAIEELRLTMDQQLETLHRTAMEVLETRHLGSSEPAEQPNGSVEIEVDNGPALKAVEVALKIQERRAKLWGTDAPAKAAVEVTTVNYSIDGVDTEQV